jgi:hypothetical protein
MLMAQRMDRGYVQTLQGEDQTEGEDRGLAATPLGMIAKAIGRRGSSHRTIIPIGVTVDRVERRQVALIQGK